MTRLPDDQIDPYESRLARRVGDFAEQAVRPFDAAAIAAAAHAGARRQPLASRLFGSTSSMARLGVVATAALVAAAAFGISIGGAGSAPGQTGNGSEPTPTAVPGGVEACAAANLTGHITAWDGAAGHRIASIAVKNAAATPCSLPQVLRPALVDSDGHALIVGSVVSQVAQISVPAGATATSMVDMANYCGAAPTGTLEIRLYLPDETSISLSVIGDSASAPDPPPCSGAKAAASIQMQPLEVK